MTDSTFRIDPQKLAAALAGPLPEVDEPSDREIAWAATYGPSTPDQAVRLLASARARRLLAHEWDQECPAPHLLDATAARVLAAADEDADLHALAVRSLLTTLHTPTCTTCASRLQELQTALSTLDRDIDLADQIIQSWAFTLTTERPPTDDALVHRGTRNTQPADANHPLRQVLDDPDLYQALTGRKRTETDHWPTLTLTPTGDPETTELTARLVVPAGIRHDTKVTVLVPQPTGDLRIPLIEPDEDHQTLTGRLTTSTWHPTSQLTAHVQATSE